MPDVRLEDEGDIAAAQQLASTLNVYQIVEDPLLISGQTFSQEADSPRRVVERWPDADYPEGHPCHNPYGVWRLGPPGGKGRPHPELAPVFMPSLAALLIALEEKSGRPLTPEAVEAARDQAACISMKHEDARKLERSRGYADLNPELVRWQWPLLRRTRTCV